MKFGLPGIFWSPRRIWGELSKWEKGFSLVLLLIALTATLFWIEDLRAPREVESSQGGTLVEGVITDDLTDFKLGRLTKAGLTRFNEKGEIIGDLAERWEISEDQKIYTFYLKPQFTAEELLPILEKNQEDLGFTQLETPEENIIRISLRQPLGIFLAQTTLPLFPYGPYEVHKETPGEIILAARRGYHLQTPYLEQLIIKAFDDKDSLRKALERGEICSTPDLSEEIEGLEHAKILFPRYQSAILNLNTEILKDKELRKKILKGEKLDSKIKLTLVASEDLMDKASYFKKKLEGQGAEVDLQVQDPLTLRKEIIEKRAFDILVFGFELGPAEDLYPFWHSSQAKPGGTNFSGFEHPLLDKLLEGARLTLDKDERDKKIKEAKELIKEQNVEFPLGQTEILYQWQPQLQGVKLVKAVESADRFTTVSEWYIKTKKVKK